LGVGMNMEDEKIIKEMYDNFRITLEKNGVEESLPKLEINYEIDEAFKYKGNTLEVNPSKMSKGNVYENLSKAIGYHICRSDRYLLDLIKSSACEVFLLYLLAEDGVYSKDKFNEMNERIVQRYFEKEPQKRLDEFDYEVFSLIGKLYSLGKIKSRLKKEEVKKEIEKLKKIDDPLEIYSNAVEYSLAAFIPSYRHTEESKKYL
jgi:hypothetical protein